MNYKSFEMLGCIVVIGTGWCFLLPLRKKEVHEIYFIGSNFKKSDKGLFADVLSRLLIEKGLQTPCLVFKLAFLKKYPVHGTIKALFHNIGPLEKNITEVSTTSFQSVYNQVLTTLGKQQAGLLIVGLLLMSVPFSIWAGGFTSSGVASHSMAAWIHSIIGKVSSGSLFAGFQSVGATGATLPIGYIGAVTAALGALSPKRTTVPQPPGIQTNWLSLGRNLLWHVSGAAAISASVRCAVMEIKKFLRKLFNIGNNDDLNRVEMLLTDILSVKIEEILAPKLSRFLTTILNYLKSLVYSPEFMKGVCILSTEASIGIQIALGAMMLTHTLVTTPEKTKKKNKNRIVVY